MNGALMPREGVSYDHVCAAAEALLSEGRVPSIRAVRERLAGTGSPNTIHRHLTAWRAQRAMADEPAPMLPSAIAREIQQAIVCATNEARAELEAQLGQARDELEQLATLGEALEAERDQLRAELVAVIRERDQLSDQAGERAAGLARSEDEASRARAAAEKARVGLAEARFELAALRQQLELQHADAGRLRELLREERRLRTEAERAGAGHEARLSSLQERFSELQAREQAAQREAQEARARLEKLSEAERAEAGELLRLGEELKSARAEGARAEAEIARLREARTTLRAEAEAHARTLAKARESEQRGALERARLLGQLEALGRAARPAEPSEQAVDGVVAE